VREREREREPVMLLFLFAMKPQWCNEKVSRVVSIMKWMKQNADTLSDTLE